MKPFRLVYLDPARADLAERIDFVLRVSTKAARESADHIVGAVNSLCEFPERFPVLPMPKEFKFPIHKCVVDNRYIILYAIEGDCVVIYRILDARRNLEGILNNL